MGVSPVPNFKVGESHAKILLAILDVQRHDSGVVLINKIHGIKSGGHKMPDIEIDANVE